MSTISIIGSGGMAAAIAGLAANAGYSVEVMSRDAVKARTFVEQIGTRATTGTFGAAPADEIVILAVPYSAVLNVVKQYGEKLAGEGVHRKSQIAPDEYRLAAHGADNGARLPAVAGPARSPIKHANFSIGVSLPG